jgi:hypothetical protein
MLAAAARRVAARLGRRGAILSLKGTIALLYGYGLAVQPIPDKRGLHLLLGMMPLCGWAIAWMCAGLTALTCAWLRERDWPGYTAVWLVTVPWSLSYLLSWWPLGENPRGWITATIFGAFGLVCLVAVGWPEPSRSRTERPRER